MAKNSLINSEKQLYNYLVKSNKVYLAMGIMLGMWLMAIVMLMVFLLYMRLY